MSQFALKLIAMLAMVLDHGADVFLDSGLLRTGLDASACRTLSILLHTLGRIAFPVFAWFCAEGCRKSRDPDRRLGRLLLFAVLSELPFQLALLGQVSPGCHNVMFTLLLASAGIRAGQILEERGLGPARGLPGAAAAALGWVLHTDYNAWGVVLVLGLYGLREHRHRLVWAALWAAVFQLLWHGYSHGTLLWLRPGGRTPLLYCLGCLAGVALLAGYNGERGRGPRWLFYWFYPGHLLVLYALGRLV